MKFTGRVVEFASQPASLGSKLTQAVSDRKRLYREQRAFLAELGVDEALWPATAVRVYRTDTHMVAVDTDEPGPNVVYVDDLEQHQGGIVRFDRPRIYDHPTLELEWVYEERLDDVRSEFVVRVAGKGSALHPKSGLQPHVAEITYDPCRTLGVVWRDGEAVKAPWWDAYIDAIRTLPLADVPENRWRPYGDETAPTCLLDETPLGVNLLPQGMDRVHVLKGPMGGTLIYGDAVKIRRVTDEIAEAVIAFRAERGFGGWGDPHPETDPLKIYAATWSLRARSERSEDAGRENMRRQAARRRNKHML